MLMLVDGDYVPQGNGLQSAKGSNVYLQKDGTIELTGRISIRGQLLINGQPYKPCTCGEGGIL